MSTIQSIKLYFFPIIVNYYSHNYIITFLTTFITSNTYIYCIRIDDSFDFPPSTKCHIFIII